MIKTLFSAAFVCLSACGQINADTASPGRKECDGPDAPVSCSFADMPENTSHIMTIPHKGSGTPMVITGRVYKEDGTPFPGVAIYAYHTDEKGIYSKNGTEKGIHKWHGQHHGWALTNEQGEYQIHSIRPAKYPNGNGPAHIHAAVKMPTGNIYWISDFVFKDDPAVSASYSSRNPGGTGIVDVKLVNGKWVGVRDLVL